METGAGGAGAGAGAGKAGDKGSGGVGKAGGGKTKLLRLTDVSHCCLACFASPATNTCSKCELARYCSRECQREHWKKHKTECRTPAERAEDQAARDRELARRKVINKWLVDSSHAGDVQHLNQLLAQGADVNYVRDDGWTALGAACTKGRKEVVRILLRAGADVNKPMAADPHSSPLMIASAESSLELADILIAAGADVNYARPDGANALGHAVQLNHAKIVSALIAAGCDVNRPRPNGSSRLMCACGQGFAATVAALIAGGANVNFASPSNGFTACMAASAHGFPECLQLLLDAGADPRAADHKGWTALDDAKHNNHTAVIAVLEAKLAALASPL